ncbi:GntR family transcriptional regulator [Streptomyces sp. NPDC051079]|uniref:GntR family transcriptional regulator n=1 Tax=Streptomyces sp. NPDC051079 TaxID=3155043 RepID=UPI00344D954D
MTVAVASRRHAIADDLRSQITAGRIKPGERLLSEARLAAHYAVSTPTLRNALALLQAEGLVEKIHGKGNYARQPLSRKTYFGGGHTPASTPLPVSIRTKRLQARGHLATLLRVAAGSPLTEFLCLSHEGRSPHSLARIYVPRDLATAATPSASCWPQEVASLLAEPVPQLAKVEESIHARLPTSSEAATLRISPTLAILAITRVATDTNGREIEAALLTLPADRAEATFTTKHTTAERRPEG